MSSAKRAAPEPSSENFPEFNFAPTINKQSTVQSHFAGYSGSILATGDDRISEFPMLIDIAEIGDRPKNRGRGNRFLLFSSGYTDNLTTILTAFRDGTVKTLGLKSCPPEYLIAVGDSHSKGVYLALPAVVFARPQRAKEIEPPPPETPVPKKAKLGSMKPAAWPLTYYWVLDPLQAMQFVANRYISYQGEKDPDGKPPTMVEVFKLFSSWWSSGTYAVELWDGIFFPICSTQYFHKKRITMILFLLHYFLIHCHFSDSSPR